MHADATSFNVTSKKEMYDKLLQEAEALLDTPNWVANTANVSSLLWHGLHALKIPVNWAGFYIRDKKIPNSLILGPFQGKVACQSIAFGKGVCGTAASTQSTQIVPDVHSYPGHIACDGDTLSEIVVPIVKNGETMGVIDIDSLRTDSFDKVDAEYLERLAELLVSVCEW